MSEQHFCHLCGKPTNTYVVDGIKRENMPNHLFFTKKVPLCESCFEAIYPSEKAKRTLYFWQILYPQIEEVKT